MCEQREIEVTEKMIEAGEEFYPAKTGRRISHIF